MDTILRIASKFHIRSGFAYGLQQPSMNFPFQVVMDENHSFSDVDLYMEERLPENFKTEDVQSLEIEKALVYRILFWTGEVQRMCRIPVSPKFYLIRFQKNENNIAVIDAAMPFYQHEAAYTALIWVIKTVLAFLQGKAPTTDEDFDELQAKIHKFAPLGTNPFHIFQAGQKLDLPMMNIPGVGIQIGYGSRRHILQSSVTEKTSLIGCTASQDKFVTSGLLRQAGLPAPVHKKVSNIDEAVEAGAEIGYPIVIKAANLDQGQNIYMGLNCEDDVRRAFKQVSNRTSQILAEKQIDGKGYRLSVFRNEFMGCVYRRPGGVDGDGKSTIDALVEQKMQDPELRRRRDNLFKLVLDEEALEMLEKQGLTPESVPDDGVFVRMRQRDNLSAGGTMERIPMADIHPDNILLAQRAARALWLEWAGIDLIIEDIGRSWMETDAVISEVNSRPQFDPGEDKSNYVKVLNMMLGDNAELPAVLKIVAEDDIPDVSGNVEKILAEKGINAVTTINGIWIDNRHYAGKQRSGFAAAGIALHCRETEGIFMIMTPREVIRLGLPTNRFSEIRLSSVEKWGDAKNSLLDTIRNLVQPHTDSIHIES
ncbi:hypothetical protein [uncultured Desulfobacter sp.]|uniref:ATP-binding protein n=1 Tax=uncultured Desulfobacter sp. TaxID=240139 RepID=UPI002AA8134A|nr:hypothetical protein [uncultured Desulfobacter sp.]